MRCFDAGRAGATIPLLGLVAGALLRPGGSAAQAAAGCYDVSLGDWRPVDSTHVAGLPRREPPSRTADSVGHAIPPRIRLHDDRPTGRGRTGFLVSVPPDALQVPHELLSWRTTPDGLRILLSTSYVGTVSTVRPAPGGWTGLARTFTDNEGTLQYDRPITLRAVDCGSEPLVPASADRALPWSVDVVGHGALALGSPLPAGVTTIPRRSGAWTLAVEPAGRWSGADTTIVRMDAERTVFHIELRYPPGFDVTPLLRRLIEELGPGGDGLATTITAWHNRTTRLSITRGRTRSRVLLIDPSYPG